LSLGFIEQARQDLERLANSDSNPVRARLAARELAMWHLHHAEDNEAATALKYIALMGQGNKSGADLRQRCIMEAEARRRLGEYGKARQILLKKLEDDNEHPDFFFALANLEDRPERKADCINQALQIFKLLPISFSDNATLSLYDRLLVETSPEAIVSRETDAEVVSVIMAAYNSERTIATAIKSILSQSWRHWELLVVDDASTDKTVAIVEDFCRRDARIRLIQAKVNGGLFVARNLALEKASGTLATCHDADDWSHPEKLERQVRHLLDHPQAIGNLSAHVRTFEDMHFTHRGKFGVYTFQNMSSFMFRRQPVMQSVGYWDSVRCIADSELISRVKKVFGKESVVALDSGPLSFVRQSTSSLTGNPVRGYHGFLKGARKEYFACFEYYHKTGGSLRYQFPQVKRPFAVPFSMLPENVPSTNDRRHFDVVIVSDFRLSGGSTRSSIEEIKAQSAMGLRTGLVQLARYDLDPFRSIISEIRDLINDDKAEMLVHGDKVDCDLLLIRYPPVLFHAQRYFPDIRSQHLQVIMNQTPMSDYGPYGVVRYDIPRCSHNLRNMFGASATWAPIGPQLRKTLFENHAADLKDITFSDDDWVNIINVEEWRKQEKSKDDNDRPYRIGRHSRDDDMKWPSRAEEIKLLYPIEGEHEVWILGGGKVPKKRLGYVPANWRIFEFGSMAPRDFLQQLDVFVYFTHRDWVESFGRVVLEAMAVGVPVIVPHKYQDLFGPAALYAKPEEVPAMVKRLIDDAPYREAQVARAFDYVEKTFGYEQHKRRLIKYVQKLRDGV
jgi:glycosyltransferase involved in cell wall biosynthesis